ncbi:MAG TPA: glycosyltransferase family 2 protein [Blastocatellia bacterium]|nr:glycosyltransferase family 2 protein [Blastocatellia bacterium]HMX26061.1 glycosyltransferase family 2 protein [Blastocatellia bacterium]HMZ20940.1 glycosyltransferase family 2 protein [Blastocatellia bacterium]HNG34248.1 glycosyltransferase family 2 protein [Blastocatellia bacterium]
MNTTTDITVLVCTYNRREDLRELLQSVLAQETGGAFRYEILVVDNNSNDGTRELVEALAAGHDNLRYLFEQRQGKSFAMNAGLNVARGAIYQIADDDLLLPPDYLRRVWQAFQTHPEVSIVAGKVLPQWSGAVPQWLTQAHWSALALSDYGATEFYTDANKPICLLAGAFRRADVEALGGYHRELGVAPNRIGGTEDVDLLARMYAAGCKGLYLPDLWLRHKVEPERLTKRYHRRWHSGHGRFYALMRAPEIERSTKRRFDVPLHLYRQAAADTAAWLSATAGGRAAAAFERETRLRFFAGFFRARAKELIESVPLAALTRRFKKEA